MNDDERREHRRQVLAQHEAKREAAWEQYRDTAAMRLVLGNPEPGDVRLAFEAGYEAGWRAALESRKPGNPGSQQTG